MADISREVGLTDAVLRNIDYPYWKEAAPDSDLMRRMMVVQNLADRFEATRGDSIGFFIEVPRLTDNEGDDAGKSEVRYGKKRQCPGDTRETCWYHVSSYSRRDDNYRIISVTDHRNRPFSLSSESENMCENGINAKEYSDSFLPLFAYLEKLLVEIAADPDGYNDYVADYLPYQQRSGWITRKEFYKIFPRRRIALQDKEATIKALNVSLTSGAVSSFRRMTLRRYCKYFRMAYKAMEESLHDRRYGKKAHQEPLDMTDSLPDVAYYKSVKGFDLSNYDIDSEEDFKGFIELLYEYCEVIEPMWLLFVTYMRNGVWRFCISASDSEDPRIALEVATKLYAAGVTVRVDNAVKCLEQIKEEGYVIVVPSASHMDNFPRGANSFLSLPWEYECSNRKYAPMTQAQYEKMVSRVEWADVDKLSLKES